MSAHTVTLQLQELARLGRDVSELRTAIFAGDYRRVVAAAKALVQGDPVAQRVATDVIVRSYLSCER